MFTLKRLIPDKVGLQVAMVSSGVFAHPVALEAIVGRHFF